MKESIQKQDQIHEKHDSLGRLVEKYGYDPTPDSEGYFKTLYYYDQQNNIIRKRHYSFFDENPECIIREKDSLNYQETIYEYNNGKLTWEKIYLSSYDPEEKKRDFTLTYGKNHITGEEIFEYPE